MKTYMPKKAEIVREWLHVDASDKILGRMAVRIAVVLMGKHRPSYAPHVDTGDFVVVTNVEKLRVTGDKLEQKEYRWYTGYPSGLRSVPLKTMMERKAGKVLRLAVRRMLPKGSLGNKMLKKLKIYSGPNHPHDAQQPREMDGI